MLPNELLKADLGHQKQKMLNGCQQLQDHF